MGSESAEAPSQVLTQPQPTVLLASSLRFLPRPLFALLSCTNNLLARKCFLNFGATSADFAVDIFILNCYNFGEGLAD